MSRILLDTHTFIWLDLEPVKLSTDCQSLLLDCENILLLSLASVWEMQVKHQLGKLTLRLPLPDLIAEQQQANSAWELLVLNRRTLPVPQVSVPRVRPLL